MNKNGRRFEVVQMDVFASRPLEGNQLAVFTDARGLSDEEMQALAREMNLSETTFILPRDAAVERERGVQVRIFTTQEELPFAGHPTLGTAFVLRDGNGASEISLDLKVGKIPVRFTASDGKPVFGEMRQRDPEFGAVHNREEVARVVGIETKDLDENLPIQTVSTGVPFTITPLLSLAVLRSLPFEAKRGEEYLRRTGGNLFYFVSRETANPKARLQARMIFYNGEDPATGSAAGCATAWMLAHGVIQPEEQALIEQGIEMKRPSQIFVRASRPNKSETRAKTSERKSENKSDQDNGVVNVRVGGNAVEVMRAEVII